MALAKLLLIARPQIAVSMDVPRDTVRLKPQGSIEEHSDTGGLSLTAGWKVKMIVQKEVPVDDVSPMIEILGADDPLAAYGLALEQGTTASWYSETLHRHAGTVAYPHPVSAARFIIQIERYPQTFVYNFVRAMPEFGAVRSSFLSP